MSILKQRFYLKRRMDNKGGDDSTIVLSLHFQGNRIIYHTGINLSSFHWDKKNCEVVNRIDNDVLNDHLNSLRNASLQIFQSILSHSELVKPVDFRNELRKLKRTPSYSLSDALINYMELSFTNWSLLTYKKFKSLYNKLLLFQDKSGKYYSIESADKEFFSKLEEFLLTESLSRLTVNAYLKQIKTFLNFAINKGWMINDSFRQFTFSSVKSKEIENLSPVYLFQSELDKLQNIRLNTRKKEHTRDIFCFLSYTGCRFEELNSLLKEDVAGTNLKIKGKNARTIILNDKAVKILLSYKNRYFRNNSLLPVYSVITINKYLKEIFTESGITRTVEIRQKTVLKRDGLDKLVSVNIAYNTFMSIAVMLGISPAVVRKWSGNKTLSRYESMLKSIDSEEKRSIEIMNQKL